MPQDRPYTPAEQAEISARYPNIEWVNGRPYTRVEEPASEIFSYDAQGNPLDYFGNPVQFQEQLVPANLEDSFPWWFLAAQLAGPAAADAVGGLLTGGAAGGGSSAATSAASTASAAPAAATTAAAPSLSAPIMGVETLAGSGGGGGFGSWLGTALSGTGPVGTLANVGIRALGSFLSGDDDDEDEGPYRFSQVDPDSELGRFTHPQNALYNSLRSTYGLGVGLADRLSKPISLPSLPGTTQSINIPGLPFSLGGVGFDSGPTTLPGLDMSALLPFLKDLTSQPAATPAVSTAQTQAGIVPTLPRAIPRPRGHRSPGPRPPGRPIAGTR